jgi:FKBP-type peptidyl-prolyl cis-trans isomerase
MMLRSRRTVVRSLAALLVAPLLACSDSTAPLLTVDDVMFAPSLNVDLDASTRAANGLAYQDLTVGTGAVAESGRTASVRYAGYLSTGTRFDDNLEPGDALLPVAIGTATTGVRTVPGFEQGITGMRVGGIRKIVIPPALGYGRQGALGNQVLVFDVELVSVQ